MFFIDLVNPDRKDYYQLLGVSKRAGSEEIQRAYDRQKERLDPENLNSEEDKMKYEIIKDAYETLSNEKSRRLYDKTGLSIDDQKTAYFQYNFFKNIEDVKKIRKEAVRDGY